MFTRRQSDGEIGRHWIVGFSAGYYNTRAWIESSTVPAGNLTVLTGGYSSPGDGGGAEYVRVGTTNPNLPGSVQDSSGVWFKLILPAEGISVHAFGAKGDGTTNDRAALQSAINFVEMVEGSSRALLEKCCYDIVGSLTLSMNGAVHLVDVESNSNWGELSSEVADATVLQYKESLNSASVKYLVVEEYANNYVRNVNIDNLTVWQDTRTPTIGSMQRGPKNHKIYRP